MRKTLNSAVIPLALLATLAGCCTPPENVKSLSKQSIQNAKILSEKQDESLNAFTKFSQDVESQVNALAFFAQSQAQKVQAVAFKALKSELEAQEAQLLLAFDDSAETLLSDEFEKALEAKFTSPIQEKFNQILREEQQLKVEAERNSNDTRAVQTYSEKEIEARAFYALALENELAIRKKMTSQLAAARGIIQAKIHSSFQALNAQIDAQTDNASLAAIVGRPPSAPISEKLVSYANIQSQIAGYGKLLQGLHAAHQQSLGTLDDYINRPSEVHLLLAGVFQGVKNELNLELPNLGNLGKSLQAPLGQIVDNTEKALQRTVTDLTGTVQNTINNQVSDFNKSVNDQLNNTIKPRSSTVRKQR